MTWYELANAILKMPDEELQKPAIIMFSEAGIEDVIERAKLFQVEDSFQTCVDVTGYPDTRILRRGEYYLC